MLKDNKRFRGRIKKKIREKLSHRDGLFYVGHTKVVFCYLCGGILQFDKSSIDHVVPLTTGKSGLHNISNLALCCMSCNKSKAGKKLSKTTARSILTRVSNVEITNIVNNFFRRSM